MRSLRESAELSQEALGERVGLDRKSINRYEVGARAMTIDRAHQIALALDVPVVWLFTDSWYSDDDAPPPSPSCAPQSSSIDG